MARRLKKFPGGPTPGTRRYPWDEWTDGSVWEIRHNEDYDVATENMRVNLHMKADALGMKVRTQKVRDEQGEGLVFQFSQPGQDAEEAKVKTTTTTTPPDEALALAHLYADAMDIY